MIYMLANWKPFLESWKKLNDTVDNEVKKTKFKTLQK